MEVENEEKNKKDGWKKENMGSLGSKKTILGIEGERN
jgi:hypothetical protein